MFFEAMHPGWQLLLADQKELLETIEKRLAQLDVAEGASVAFLPEPKLVMRAFETDPSSVRVLLIGQDPYPTPGHAVGLAFACSLNVSPQPRSLQNIRAELASDLGVEAALTSNINLENWVAQGVMLLNRTLTVAPGQAGAHQKLGWQTFTATAIERLAVERGESLAVVLWGKPAQAVAGLVEPFVSAQNILVSAHPSPLSARRGFFGSRPFSRMNALLAQKGLHHIDWLG